ncbi:sodium:proton antiporter [Paramagnetospirillum marisnigri]|uniref:Na(+)/H(+) antiporter NhaA n=1 Tax=Paramagnetospirillum marisnigri TaxID=1285242 RepID=A0A178MP10_9PROT|nr:Na+/H+ antiporter NhaA [Paramagnetospirillum marisnigri]OAN50530.1 sodium:proton antiporter [Paramagnetospirillum marisnigri]
MSLSRLRALLRHDAAGGVVLMAAALAAMAFANSPLHSVYEHFLETRLSLQAGELVLAKPLHHWVNDGLMAVFFLMVGLEIKREVLEGELSSLRQASLPLIAALGGMAAPALVYLAVTWGDAEAMRGWAIPAATDIAFAVGVLALAGKRVPPSLRIFLLALAIMDDLGAIVIIALFYTAQLSVPALVLAALALMALAALNRSGVTAFAPYVVVGAILWACVLESGVHATLAGVALGFAIPLRGGGGPHASPLRVMEHGLHPWVTFAILPLFAFANAGVFLGQVSAATLADPITVGVAAGLFLGKPIGVMAATLAAIGLGLGRMPAGASLGQFFGVAVLTGIGFTMSLFIGTLAFDGIQHDNAIRLGVLGGSLASAVLGSLLLARRPAT